VKKLHFLIIGSNSFSGSHFVDHLLSLGHNVVGISRSKNMNNIFLPYKKNKNVKNFVFFKIDLNVDKDNDKIISLIKQFKISHVVNFAAQAMVAESWLYPIDYYKTNVISLVNLTNKLIKYKLLKKFVHVSTPEVYGNITGMTNENTVYNPSTPYAISRSCLDMHLMALKKNYNFPVVFTRAANVYGPGQQLYRIVPKSIICALNKKKIQLHGGGKSMRSFVYITDVAYATYKIAVNSKPGNIYHISNNNLISIKSLVDTIFKSNGLSSKKYINVTAERPGKDKYYTLKSLKLKREYNWKPKVSLSRGLSITRDWVSKNLKKINNLSLHYEHKK